MTELDKEISTLRSGLKAVEMVSMFPVLIPGAFTLSGAGDGVQRRSCWLPWHAHMLRINIYCLKKRKKNATTKKQRQAVFSLAMQWQAAGCHGGITGAGAGKLDPEFHHFPTCEAGLMKVDWLESLQGLLGVSVLFINGVYSQSNGTSLLSLSQSLGE